MGDAIVEINGVNVENCSHDEVVKLLKESGDEVQLQVKHNRSMAPFLRGGTTTFTPCSTDRATMQIFQTLHSFSIS